MYSILRWHDSNLSSFCHHVQNNIEQYKDRIEWIRGLYKKVLLIPTCSLQLSQAIRTLIPKQTSKSFKTLNFLNHGYLCVQNMFSLERIIHQVYTWLPFKSLMSRKISTTKYFNRLQKTESSNARKGRCTHYAQKSWWVVLAVLFLFSLHYLNTHIQYLKGY